MPSYQDSELTQHRRHLPKAMPTIDYDADLLRAVVESQDPHRIQQLAGPAGIMRRLASDPMRGIDPDSIDDRVHLGGANHFRHGKNVSHLTKGLENEEVCVIRDGQMIRVAGKDLVIGDLVMIEPGMKMPADALLVQGSASVYEGEVSGKTDLRAKAPDADPVMLSAAEVKQGGGKAVVIAVGQNASLNKLLKEL